MSDDDGTRRSIQHARQSAHWPAVSATRPAEAARQDLLSPPAKVQEIAGTAVELSRAAAIVAAHLERSVLAPAGMSWRQYMLLRTIYQHVSLRVQDAAELLATTMDETVATARQLQKRGLVEVSGEGAGSIVLTNLKPGDHTADELQHRLATEESKVFWFLTRVTATRVRTALAAAAVAATASRSGWQVPPT